MSLSGRSFSLCIRITTRMPWSVFCFFFNDTATTEIYTLTHSFPTRRSSDLFPRQPRRLALHERKAVEAAFLDAVHTAGGGFERIEGEPEIGRIEIGRAHV